VSDDQLSSPTPRLDPIPSLTGLRGLAALLVVVSHAVDGVTPSFQGHAPVWWDEVSQLAGLGMPMFFVLSGFVIHYNYSSSITSGGIRGLRDFFVARFARLYPLYFVFVLYCLLDSGVFQQVAQGEAGASTILFHPLGYYLTLTQSWFYNLNHG